MLKQTNGVKRQISCLQTDLGDVLRDIGDYSSARESYEVSLAISQELEDIRHTAIAQGQLGALALIQKNLPEATQRYKITLKISQQINEPELEAISLHQLGRIFELLHQWEDAEQAYRQSAQIKESQGLIGGSNGAVTTWSQLAIICQYLGRLEESEEWYLKVIEADRKTGDRIQLSKHLSNLATILQQLPKRLNEVQQLAEESLAIKKTFDPAAVEIWLTYGLLAEISDKQGDAAKAKDYRRESRAARANFAGTEYELRQHAPLIRTVVTAIDDAEVRQQLEAKLQSAPPEWQNLIAAIRQIFNGERDEDILCERLGIEEAQIILAILGQVKSKK